MQYQPTHFGAATSWKRFAPDLSFVLFVFVAAVMMLVGADAHAQVVNEHLTECGIAVANTGVGFGGSGFSLGITAGAAANPICALLISLNDMIKGTTGKAIATVAIMALGLGALFGKITWTQAMVVVLGVGLLFGAASVMGSFSPTVIAMTNADPISAVLNTMAASMTGNTGRAIAVIAVAVLGIGALYGKISWPQAMVYVTGIGLAFGGLGLVQYFWTSQDATVNIFNIFVDTNSDPLGGPFMQIIAALTGELGISIATAAVMALGFAAMLGKVSWVRALLLMVGIALVFGAADIVQILRGPLSPCTESNSDPFTQVVCGFMKELQGPLGKTVATVAIIIIGILAMLGKVSWELGLVCMVGIAMISGADALVNLFEVNMAGVTCSQTAPTSPSTGNAIADVLCYILRILFGPAGKSLATIAVSMMGFGALMGKVSYSQAFVVAVGIAVMFGAPTLVAILMPSAVLSGCDLTGFGGILGGGGGGGGIWAILTAIVFGGTGSTVGISPC